MEGKYTRGDLKLAKKFRLDQLISIHPNASYQTLNPILKKEFGSGMRKQDMLRQIKATRPISKPIPRAVRKAEKVEVEPKVTRAKPKAEKISAAVLKKLGFYDFEIKKIRENYANTDKAVEMLKAAAHDHREYIRRLELKAYRQGHPNPKQAVRDMLKRQYDKGNYDPYDWFKEVYPKIAGFIPNLKRFREAEAKLALDRLATVKKDPKAKIKSKTESLRLWR